MKTRHIILLGFLFCYLLPASAQIPSWFSLGAKRYPQGTVTHEVGIGHVAFLCQHPKDSMTIYACTDGGGLWVSHTRGAGWIPLTDSIPALLHTNCLAINPVYTDSMLLGDAGNLYISTDGGNHWNPSKSAPKAGILRLIIDPANRQHIVAGTYGGIYTSFDGGNTWKRATTSSTTILDLAMRPTKGGSRVLYAVSYDSFFMSKDFGDTWIKNGVGMGIKPDTIYNFAGMRLGISSADSLAVCVLAIAGSDYGGLFYSTDGGINFKPMSYKPYILGYDCSGSSKGGQGSYNICVEMHPDSPSVIWVGSENIWVSRDSGKTWKSSSCWYSGVHEDKHDFHFDPFNHNRLYIAHDGGIDVTTDNGLHWDVRANTLSASEFYHMGQSHVDREFMGGGLQDNGYEMYVDGDFYNVGAGDGYYPFTFNWKGRAYGSLNVWLNKIYKNFAWDGLGYSSSTASIAFSPVDSGVAYIYDNKDTSLFISKNIYASGSSIVWKKINIAKLALYNFSVKVLPSAVSADKAFIICTSYTVNKIYHLTNTKSASPAITSVTMPSGYASISISCSAQWDSVLYMSAYSTVSSKYGVYRSTNFGKTWTGISTGIPSNIPSMELLVDYSSKNEAMYFYTYLHVYYRDNTLKKWIPYMKGLPMVAQITKADIYCDSTGKGLLRVSTYGRGIWQVPLYSSTIRVPVVEFNALPDQLDCNGIYYINNTSYNDPASFKWSIFPDTGWQFINGTTDSSRNPQLQITQTGTYTLSLKASNSAGNGFGSEHITWSGISKPDSCINRRLASKYPGTQNITLKFANDTSLIYNYPNYYTYLAYFDKGCKVHFIAHPGQKIPLAVEGKLDYTSLYIDYNNNGKFESKEFVTKFPTPVSPWTKQSFTIPLKGIVTDTFIRMRLVTNNTKISGPCMTLDQGVGIDVALMIDATHPRISIKADSSVIYGRTKLTITASEPLQTIMDTSLFKVIGARLESLSESGPLQWSAILRPLRPGLIQVMLDSNKIADLAGNLNNDTAYAVLWHDLKIKTIAFKGQDSLKLDTVSHTILAWLGDTANPATKIYFSISPKAKLETDSSKLISGQSLPKYMYPDSLWVVAYDKSDSIGYRLKINPPACLKVNTWYGSVSNNWYNATNWCAGAVPDSNSDVFIPVWASNQPTINRPAFCRNINIDSAAFVTMNSSLSLFGKATLRGKLLNNHHPLVFASSSPQTIPAGNWDNIHAIRSVKTLQGRIMISDSLYIAKVAQIETGTDTIYMLSNSWLSENADSLLPTINGYISTTSIPNSTDSLSFSNLGISIGKTFFGGIRPLIKVTRISGDSALLPYNYKLPGYKVFPSGISYIMENSSGFKNDTAYFSLQPIGRRHIGANVFLFESLQSKPSLSDSFSLFNSVTKHPLKGDLLKAVLPASGKSVFFSIADASLLSDIKSSAMPANEINAWLDQLQNRIIIEVNSIASQKMHISLRDIAGRQMNAIDYNSIPGKQRFSLILNPNLATGNYILNIEGGLPFRKLIAILAK